MSRARDRADGDFAGKELIFDADADTSITADTDDQIDIKVGGTDTVVIKPDEMILQGPHPSFTLTDSDDTNGGGIFYNNGSLAVAADTGNTGATGLINFQIDGNTDVSINGGGDLTIADGNLVIGTSGHGIDFSATANTSGMAAELFDDYEEGLWDATLTPQTSGSVTVDGAANACQYTKIGRMVFLSGLVQSSGVSSPVGVLRMSGLPFAVADLADYGGRTLATINIQAGAIPPNNYGMWFSEGDSFGSIYNFTDSEQPQATASNNFGGNESIYFSVIYRTA